MPASSIPQEILELFATELLPSQRLLTLDIDGLSLIPHRLEGTEALSESFRYTVDCVSQQRHIELKTLMAQPAALAIRQADGSYRTRHALVTEARYLGEDGGVAYYQLTLAPWFEMLTLGRDSRIFQDKSVIDVLKAVFDDVEAAHGRYRFDLQRDYPPRSYCVQYRESDANFVSRLLEEEGLWFYWEFSASSEGDTSDDFGHRLVITDDVDTTAAVAPQAIRYHRQAATEESDAITQWRGQRHQQPTRVSIGTFDYKQPSLSRRSALDTITQQGNVPRRELYDYAGEYYFKDSERGERLARNRIEAFESLSKRFFGSGGARQLQAGRWFELTQHPQHQTGGEEESQFLVLSTTVYAENALPVSTQMNALPGSLKDSISRARERHDLVDDDDTGYGNDYRRGGTALYLVEFEAQRRSQPYRHPLTHHRPVVGGPQTATVVGPQDEEIFTDQLNRVRVQFHWDRLGQSDDRASAWLRVAQPNAGEGWGGVFVPRIGEEVIVTFLEGDADRPLVTGRVYNSDQSPEWHSHGLLSGFKSKTYKGSKFNELVFDDATDQERVRLGSEHQKSQLNLGYLIHQTGNHRGAFRGTGFELRTDGYGAVRANQGLYLSSWGQLGANGDQLDVTPVYQQLQSAHSLSQTLSDTATEHNGEALSTTEPLKQAADDSQDRYGDSAATDTDQSNASAASASGGRGEAERIRAPWLHAASPAGIALTTSESTHLAQGKSLGITAGDDISIATGGSFIASLRKKLSLFVYRAGIKLFAAKGKVELQAQGDGMSLTARNDLSMTSTQGEIRITSANGITLGNGGGQIRIQGGNIEIHSPGTVDVKGAQHLFADGASMQQPSADLPDAEGPYEQYFSLKDEVTGELLPYSQYRAETAEGKVFEGRADGNGMTSKILTRQPEQLKLTILDRLDDT